MRLLITLEYPPQKGGVANYLAGICGVLSDTAVLNVKLSRFIWPKWFPVFLKVFRMVRKKRPEIIFVSHILPIGYIALLFKFVFDVPYIVFTHGMDVLMAQKNFWKKFWLKKILKNANIIIANSEFTRSEILKLGIKKEKTGVVYPCPNPEIKIIQFNKKTTNKKIILSVGRLIKRKGFDNVIRAMPKILKEIPGAIYLLVGSGPYKNELEKIRDKNNLKKNIIFVDGINDKEMHAYYGMSDVLVMPSRRIDSDVEGFGIVYLEAALFGKPSIAGKDGGMPEAVLDNETGFVVDGENPDEIANATIKLLKDNELREKMGERARKRVLEEFRWEKQSEKIKF